MDNKKLIDNIFDEDFDRDWAFYAKQGKADPAVEEVVRREIQKGSDVHLKLKAMVDESLNVEKGKRGCTYPYLVNVVSNALMIDFYAKYKQSENTEISLLDAEKFVSKSKCYENLKGVFWQTMDYINGDDLTIANEALKTLSVDCIILLNMILYSKLDRLERKFDICLRDSFTYMACKIVSMGKKYYEEILDQEVNQYNVDDLLEELEVWEKYYEEIGELEDVLYMFDEAIEAYHEEDDEECWSFLDKIIFVDEFFKYGLHIKPLTIEQKMYLYMIYKKACDVISYKIMINYLIENRCISDYEAGVLCIILESLGGCSQDKDKFLDALGVSELWKKWDLRYEKY